MFDNFYASILYFSISPWKYDKDIRHSVNVSLLKNFLPEFYTFSNEQITNIQTDEDGYMYIELIYNENSYPPFVKQMVGFVNHLGYETYNTHTDNELIHHIFKSLYIDNEDNRIRQTRWLYHITDENTVIDTNNHTISFPNDTVVYRTNGKVYGKPYVQIDLEDVPHTVSLNLIDEYTVSIKCKEFIKYQDNDDE